MTKQWKNMVRQYRIRCFNSTLEESEFSDEDENVEMQLSSSLSSTFIGDGKCSYQ